MGSGGGILNFGAVTLTNSAPDEQHRLGHGRWPLQRRHRRAGRRERRDVTGSTGVGQQRRRRRRRPVHGLRGSLTANSSSIKTNASSAQGGGIAAVDSTATSLTSTAVSINSASPDAGGIYRLGGTMTTATSPITFNTATNCVGSRSPGLHFAASRLSLGG